MVALDIVRQANRQLSTTYPSNPTALFVGGTTGIGQSTLRQFAKYTEKPSVYIVGRSKSKAAPFLSELQQTNPNGSFNFLEADVTLIGNVDKVCQELKTKEQKLNLLFMTPGGISLTGRNETSEGLDKLFALRYYSRMRFIQQLLPLLEQGEPSRVVSIFGGGFEGPIQKDDLDIKRRYSLINCAFHGTTMTSLAMEHLASQTKSQNLSFIHAFPGIVGTNIYTNSFPAPIAAIYNYIMWPMMWPFSVNLNESGERHLYHATSPRYAGSGPTKDAATGSDGKTGSGLYLMNWKGETSTANKTMQRYRDEGMAEIIWSHTEKLLDAVAAR